MVPFLGSLLKCLLLTHFKKNSTIVKINTKKVICDTGSINMQIRANEAFSNITS